MTFFKTERREKLRARAAEGKSLYDRPRPPPLHESAEEGVAGKPKKGSLPAGSRLHIAALNISLLGAVRAGDVTAAKKALDDGANVEASERPLRATHYGNEEFDSLSPAGRKWGDSPLMIAAKNGDLAMVAMLLARGADVHRDYGYGSPPLPTALTYARRGGHEEVAKLLIQHGARDVQ